MKIITLLNVLFLLVANLSSVRTTSLSSWEANDDEDAKRELMKKKCKTKCWNNIGADGKR